MSLWKQTHHPQMDLSGDFNLTHLFLQVSARCMGHACFLCEVWTFAFRVLRLCGEQETRDEDLHWGCSLGTWLQSASASTVRALPTKG